MTDKTSITVSRETLKLANRIKSFRSFRDSRNYGLDDTLQAVLKEELQRINRLLKQTGDKK